MPRTSTQPKEESFNFRVPTDLKIAFQEATERADQPAAQVIRNFMRVYVSERKQQDVGYDLWFRRQVQAALNDPHKPIPHTTVMQRTRAAIHHMADKK